jgi:hypothetical protein
MILNAGKRKGNTDFSPRQQEKRCVRFRSTLRVEVKMAEWWATLPWRSKRTRVWMCGVAVRRCLVQCRSGSVAPWNARGEGTEQGVWKMCLAPLSMRREGEPEKKVKKGERLWRKRKRSGVGVRLVFYYYTAVSCHVKHGLARYGTLRYKYYFIIFIVPCHAVLKIKNDRRDTVKARCA